MKKNYVYFLGLPIFLFVLVQLFIYSDELKHDDEFHQQEFNSQYGIFALLKPQELNFAGEKTPIQSPEIWERLDKELLKNTYFQSSTMLYFKKANKYFPIIEPILKKNNIPDDFKYLAVIESGLDNVVSPAGAAGFWQILKGTAREYGLEVNSEIDERYHLEKATEFACSYLNDSYEKFGSWTIAAASYNMGKNGVKIRMSQQETTNYYNLHLNEETAKYIFRIIAVKDIMENPKKYGFIFRSKDLYVMPEYKNLEVDSTIPNLSVFAKEHGINYKLLKEFNPWLMTSSLPDQSRKKYILKIPTDTDLLISEHLERETH